MSSDDAHAARNAAQLANLDRERSHRLVKSHNALVEALNAIDDGFSGAFLDDAQTDTVEDALDQLAAVADSIRDDDRVTDERLLLERGSR